MKRRTSVLLIFFLVLGNFGLLRAQESLHHSALDALYYRALDLYQKEVYPAAQQLFIDFVEKSTDEVNHLKSNAVFYSAMCAIELNNSDAEYKLAQFIKNYPESQKINQAYFAMGKIRYQLKQYHACIRWLKRIDTKGLAKESVPEMHFMLGYSYFQINDLETANRYLFQVKDLHDRFAAPATYYYCHIAYHQKNYATALKGFKSLETNKLFAPIVPYYIAQIYYLQGDYRRVIAYAPAYVRNNATKRTPEIARIVGESFFREKEYDSAQVFLQLYADKTPQLTRNDYYLMGYANYQVHNYLKATEYLEHIPTVDDSLSQNANYHLADCYLATNQPVKARQAFALAWKPDFDPSIKEDALFNFAKLTYEQLYAPFNEAIVAFNRYITLYPNSPRIDEAYNYLTLVYLSTRNYKEAVEALDKIHSKDPSMKAAYQRAAFFRGIELFQNMNFPDAIKFFDLAQKYDEYNPTLAALTLYWQAEAYYRLNNFTSALQGYQKFIVTPGAFGLSEFNMAHYNLGYANFKIKNYEEAIVWFRKYTSLCHDDTTLHVADAYNRIGDSFFIQRKFWPAIDYYDKSVQINKLDADYAIFQRGFALGLVERPEKKIATLETLAARFPESPYVDDAIFEIAESQMLLERMEEAQLNYSIIVEKYPGSSYYVKSLVQLGLACYNTKQTDKALGYYKRVVEGFPNTPEAKNALLGLRNIFVDRGQADLYFEYASTLGNIADLSYTQKDSLAYTAAENIYIGGDCDKSITSLKNYLAAYPNGNFAVNAHYYLADCYIRLDNQASAVDELRAVVASRKNTFTEQSYLQLGRILIKEGRFQESYDAYNTLETIAELKPNVIEARLGKMRNAFLMNNFEDVVTTGRKVLLYDKLSGEAERAARYRMGFSLEKLQRYDEALTEYSKIAKQPKTFEGAEARFRMVQIFINMNDLDRAEQEVFDFAEVNTPHQIWLAKCFILLADVYTQHDDFFQAKATLQSILDGYTITDDGVLDEAQQKMDKLLELEKRKQSPFSELDTVAIMMDI